MREISAELNLTIHTSLTSQTKDIAIAKMCNFLPFRPPGQPGTQHWASNSGPVIKLVHKVRLKKMKTPQFKFQAPVFSSDWEKTAEK